MSRTKRTICEVIILAVSAILLTALIAFQGLAQATKDPAPAAYLKEATVSESAGAVHIDANSPRPLEQVLAALRQKYGWIVAYEDPQYTAASDLLDAPVGMTSGKIPSGGAFSVQFPAKAPDEEKTLRAVVDSYNQSKNPGRFELRKGAQGTIYVVGTGARDEKGAIATQPVPLDLPVTLAAEERSITDAITKICEQISTQSHIDVTLGIYPRTVLDNTPVKLGGNKTPARDLLLQSLQASKKNLYWRLLYDPTSKGYFLSVHSTGSK